jgi:hypothetical protein
LSVGVAKLASDSIEQLVGSKPRDGANVWWGNKLAGVDHDYDRVVVLRYNGGPLLADSMSRAFNTFAANEGVFCSISATISRTLGVAMLAPLKPR